MQPDRITCMRCRISFVVGEPHLNVEVQACRCPESGCGRTFWHCVTITLGGARDPALCGVRPVPDPYKAMAAPLPPFKRKAVG